MSDYLARLAFGFARKLPVVLQTEAAECGLACLASILGFHGFHTDLRLKRALLWRSCAELWVQREVLAQSDWTRGKNGKLVIFALLSFRIFTYTQSRLRHNAA